MITNGLMQIKYISLLRLKANPYLKQKVVNINILYLVS